MADTERTPATSAGEQVELEREDAIQEIAGPTAAESPTPGDEGAESTTAAPPAPTTTETSELEKRLAILTDGEPTANPPEVTSTEQPAATGTDEPEADKAKEPPELPEDVRKRIPREAAKAFAEMRHSLKEARARVEQYESDDAPVAEFGRSLLATIGDAFQDLQGLDDAEIREAIQERAAIKRGERQKPTGPPPELIAKLDAALAAADETLDLSEIRTLIESAKGSTAATPPVKTATAPPPTDDRGQQQPAERTAPNREAIQVLRTRNALLADGVKADQLDTYVRGRLIPGVLGDLQNAFPGQNPAALFNSMDPSDRTQLLLDKHRLQHVQTKTPAKAPPLRQRTPLTSGSAGRNPAAGGPPVSTNLSERLAYLNEAPA